MSVGEIGGRICSATGGTRRSPDIATLAGFARTWWRAVRAPWTAAVSLAACALVAIQLLRSVFGALEEASMVTSLLLVFGPATAIATLPQSTVLWRVASLGVAMHAGPISYAPPEAISFSAFLDSWGRTISDDRGMLVMLLWAVLSLPALELLGAWLRRGSLLHEASYRTRTPVARKDAR